MNKFFLGAALLFTSLRLQSQNETLTWINENAHSIEHDLTFLSKELKGKTVVALGEASHGTHEFYVEKGRIIQYLITKLDYKSLGFEYAKTDMMPINQYLQDGTGDLRKLMEGLRLYCTTEIFGVFQWIRDYNKSASPKDKIVVFGYDHSDFQFDPMNRDKYMADTIIDFLKTHRSKSIIWAHNVHIAKDTTMARFKAMGSHLKKEYGDSYYALCFDTFSGSVNVWANNFEPHEFKAEENTYSGLLASAKYRTFFLSFNTKPNPLVGTRNHITHINANWQVGKSLPIKPGVDFDGMVFIRNTSPSVRLTQK